jgi:hypothetical protein
VHRSSDQAVSMVTSMKLSQDMPVHAAQTVVGAGIQAYDRRFCAERPTFNPRVLAYNWELRR